MPGFTRATAHRNHGFTLIELLVVIAIATILLGIGVPNLQSFLIKHRLSTQANDLHTALQFARSEALRRNAPVTLRRVGATGTGNWSAGWTLFSDANGNGVIDSSDVVLRESPALPAPLTLYSSDKLASSLTFDGRGRAASGGGSFVLCHGDDLAIDGQSRSRAVLINAAGRIRLGTDANQDGVIETDTGAVSSCTQP
ncbi:MAG: GspH/FimT family pseudopilin [Burkholderiaceae bacterium]